MVVMFFFSCRSLRDIRTFLPTNIYKMRTDEHTVVSADNSFLSFSNNSSLNVCLKDVPYLILGIAVLVLCIQKNSQPA